MEEKEKEQLIRPVDLDAVPRLTDTLECAPENTKIADYIGGILNWSVDCLNNKRATSRYVLVGNVEDHQRWLKLFVMTNCTKYARPSDQHVDLPTLAFLAYLHLVPEVQQPPVKAAVSSELPTVRTERLLNHLWRRSTESPTTSNQPAAGTAASWTADLVELEQASRQAFITDPRTANEPHRDLLEKCSRAYAHVCLQLHYWVKASHRQVDNKEQLLAIQKECAEYQDSVRQLAPSDEFCSRFSNLVYEHGLGAAGWTLPRKCNAVLHGKNMMPNMPLPAVANKLLPPQLAKTIYADIRRVLGQYYPRCAFASSQLLPPPSDQKSSSMVNKTSSNHYKDLLDILTFVYRNEQELRMDKWTERYFLSALDWLSDYGRLENSIRHLDVRRPIVLPLLGYWAVCTHDGGLYVAPTGFEAVCIWMLLFRTVHQGRFEGQF